MLLIVCIMLHVSRSGQIRYDPLNYDPLCPFQSSTANLCTKILDFKMFGSSIILVVRGGIFMSIGSSQEMLSQRILVGIIVVGRLDVGAGTVGFQKFMSLSARPWGVELLHACIS